MWDYVNMVRGFDKVNKGGGMELSPMQIMLENKRDEKSMRSLSDGLRRRKDVGELISLVGTRNQQGFGGGLREDVRAQQGLKEKQDNRNMMLGQYEAANTYRDSALAETIRHNKAMEKSAQTRADAAAAGARFRSPSVSAVKKTEDNINQYEGIRRTLASYKPDYANNTWLPFEGKLSNTIGKYTGSQDQKDQSRWWADYDLLYTLGTRNKLFGSALTESEIRAWEGANISPNSPPEVIEAGLKTLMEIATRKFQQSYTSDATLYDPMWVNSQYAPYLGDPQAGAAEASPPQETTEPTGSVSWSDL